MQITNALDEYDLNGVLVQATPHVLITKTQTISLSQEVYMVMFFHNTDFRKAHRFLSLVNILYDLCIRLCS